MKRSAIGIATLAWLLALPGQAFAHDCRILGNGNLLGSYEGDCEEKNEIAHGHGTAIGTDRYVGTFVKGRLDGSGIYTWQSGARLEGTFKNGKADGPGVFTSANGTRYEGRFTGGKLEGLSTADCPPTQGPLSC